MTTGTDARLDRIGTDGNYVIVPMDHGITLGPVTGLKDIESTIDAVTRGGADAVLTQRGIAPRVHEHKNEQGYIVHLNASTSIGPDSNDKRLTGTVEDAIRVGADAVSFHINVGSNHEPDQITQLSEVTSEAARYGIPVLAMAYARGPDVDSADSFEHVCESTRLPVVIAGGSKGTDRETIEMVRGAMDAGGSGISMGRSIFQHEDPEGIAAAVAGVVHDDLSVDEALETAGLALEV